MGVHGLKAQIEKHGKPVLRTLNRGEGKGEKLLIDAAALCLHVVSTVLGEEARAGQAGFIEAAYAAALKYCQRLVATGLRCIAVLEGAADAGHEARHVDQARKSLARGEGGGCWVLAIRHAMKDAGVELLQAKGGADPLLLHLAIKSQDVFAVLTSNTDFFVYTGVSSVSFVGDVVVGATGTSFVVWNVADAWAAWKRAASHGKAHFSAGTSLTQRAHVAGVMGTDSGAGVKQRLEGRGDVKEGDRAAERAEGVRTKRVVSSPSWAAALALCQPTEDLPMTFFTKTLSLKKFEKDDFTQFQAVVKGYLDDHAFASEAPLEALTVSQPSLPHCEPGMIPWLKCGLVPTSLLSFAARGFGTVLGMDGVVPQQTLRFCFEVRRAAAANLFLKAVPPSVYEFEPASGTIFLLRKGGSPIPGWFNPEKNLPSLPVNEDLAAAPPELPMRPGGTLAETVEAVRGATEGLAEDSIILHAMMVHLATPGDKAVSRQAARAALMPNLPDAKTMLAALQAEDEAAASEEAEDEAALAAVGKGNAALINTGSSLTKDDWGDFDAKDVVARTRAGGAFKLMQVLQPFDKLSSYSVPQLRREEVFDYFFTQRKEPGFWKEMLEDQFNWEYHEVSKDKARKKAIDAVSTTQILANLASMPNKEGEFTHRWLSAVSGGKMEDLLELKRIGDVAGTDSLEYAVGMAVWKAAREPVREAAEQRMYSCENRSGFHGIPRRFPHQQEVVDLVEEHLSGLQATTLAARPAPLHIILSTPTGSGKTFTAVMLSLQVLREKFPDAILVYSVPTKQVLKRVGQDCEAHKLPYWTASQTGNLYEVRRPYSIRTEKSKKSEAADKGDIKQQLNQAHQLGRAHHDRGTNGLPSVIVADVFAASAILQAASADSPQSPFHMDNLVLYFDEPNMGIHLNAAVLKAARSIMRSGPRTCILASATLPPWGELEKFWYGGINAQRLAITQKPYSLPMSDLLLYDMERAEARPVSVLELFHDVMEFGLALDKRERLSVLLLRHLSPEHALDISGQPAETVEERWSALNGEVKVLREGLEPQLRSLAEDPQEFAELRVDWAAHSSRTSQYAPPKLSSALSKTGITMVATLNPRRVALELAGWSAEPGPEWLDAVHAMSARWKEADRVHKAAVKASQRTQKKTEDDDMMVDEPVTGSMTVKKGVEVMLTDEIDPDTLVMLSRGVAYSCGDGSEGPVVKRIYAQALLHVPEASMGRASSAIYPINVLVVDYSSIYGTDCPGVDRVVMMDDIGELLTFEDHQQFIGRLRRDGTAVFLSDKTMRAAVAGLGERPQSAAAKVVAKVQAGEAELSGAAAAVKAGEPLLTPPSQTAQSLLREVLALTPPGEKDGKSPAAQVVKQLTRWAPVLDAVIPKGQAKRAAFLRAAEALLSQPRYLAAVPMALKALYDEDVVEEDAVLAWCQGALKRAERDGRAKAVAAKAKPFVEWLQEADSDEDEEDDDE